MRFLVPLLLLGSLAGMPIEPPTGWIGIVFTAQPDGARVKLVLPDTPAEQGDVRPGDLLLAVDGISLIGLDVPGMKDAFANDVGSDALLKVQRGQRQFEVTITRIARPDDDRLAELKAEAELRAAPPERRAAIRLARLDQDVPLAGIMAVWQAYLDERGERPIKEPLVFAVLDRLVAGGPTEAVEAAISVLAAAEPFLGEQARYHRRAARIFNLLAMREQAAERARRGLQLAGPGHIEHAQLQRMLTEALLATGDLEGAEAASATMLETWEPPTLLWMADDGVETARLVVDGSSRLSCLRAEVLAAAGDEAGAREVLSVLLAHRYDEDAAAALSELGGSPPPAPRPAFPVEAEDFPGFGLTLLDGEGTVEKVDLLGGPVLVTFWASWCAPCRNELEHLTEIYPSLLDAGATVLAVNTMDELADARGSAASGAWPFPVVRDGGDILARAMGVQSLPRTFIVDAGGRVVASFQGYSERGMGEQLEILRRLGQGEAHQPHLVELEQGDERLVLRHFFPLPQARGLALGAGGEILVGTTSGRALPVGPQGLDRARERESPIRLVELAALDGGTWAGRANKSVALLPAEGEATRLPVRVMAFAAAGDQLFVALAGRKPLQAYDAGGELLWTGGADAVTWDLFVATGPDGASRLGRLSPGQLEWLTVEGEVVGTGDLPGRINSAEPVAGGVVLSSRLEVLTQGDLDADGADETVVLLDSRHVIGLSPQREVLFRFSLPVDGDILCADTDADGRAELWVASAAAGVFCLGFSLPADPPSDAPGPGTR